jgi:iron complex outermembrane receptor protein
LTAARNCVIAGLRDIGEGARNDAIRRLPDTRINAKGERLMRKACLASTTILGGLFGLASASPALAQAAETAAAPPSGGDIIVTARRVEERLQDVPISITVFNQQQLTNRNVTNAQDLAIYTPSLSVNSNFGSQNSTFAIRGFVQDIGTAPSVGVYFADVVAPRGPTQGTSAGDGAGPGQLFDLQNVQVLKGPQGTLFGRNTTGGAVLLVPQKPTSKFGGYVEGSFGDYGMKRGQAVLNVPLSDIARFRIAIDHQSRDGYLKNDSGVGPTRFDDVNYTAVRASLVVDLTPDLENYIIASYSDSRTNGDIQKMIACNPTASAANFLGLLSCAQMAAHAGDGFYTLQQNGLSDPRAKLEQWQVIDTTTWKASDALTVKNIVSYAELRDYYRSTLFGTDWYLGPQALPFIAIAPAPGAYSAAQSTFTEELQFQGNALAERLTWQAGGYMEISDPIGLEGNRNPQLISCADLATFTCNPVLGSTSAVNAKTGNTYFHDTGLYAQANYSLTGKLKLTGGFRYTWDKQKSDLSGITYLFPTANVPVAQCTDPSTSVLPNCEISSQVKSHAPTWLIDLDYKPTDAILLYAKYARGYRAGGVFPPSPLNYRVFQPERVDSYEVGLKSSFGGALHGLFDLSGFYNNFTNQQLEVGFNTAPGAVVAPTTGVINAGKSRIYGFETEIAISPFKGFRLDGSYTYLHARILSIAPLVSHDPNYLIAASIEKGDVLALSPTNKATITGSYQLPLDASVGKVTAEATFSYTSKQLSTYQYSDPAVLAVYGGRNLGILQPQKLVNLDVTWNSVMALPVDLSFFMTNATGQKYYTYVPGLGPNGFESAAIGAPRMFGGRLRYRFGA